MAAPASALGVAARVLAGIVAAPALVLTLARLTAGNQPALVRVVSFTPLAIPLYVVALALAAVPLLRGPRKRLWAGVCAALGVALVLQLSWVAPLYVGSTPPAAAGATPLVVMNANMYLGRGDATTLVDAVRRHRVGLLVVEEVTPDLLARLDAAGLRTMLPHIAGDPAPDGHGTMVFSTRPITDVTPIPTGLESWAMTVGDLRVLAVHPAFAYPHDTWASDQATVLRAVRADHPDLLIGDLNATLDHAAVRALLRAGLADGAAQSNAGWDPTWPANGLFHVVGLRPPPLVEIDHVMVGSRLTVRSFRDIGVLGTDHRAVIASVVRRG